ncbi:hypothetical protein LIER_03765 [Lithospermum erythrorhizon]|uniref:Uncharacterized protein n=1 Tax=Lithospermum erythrorhizon TaxID=34254 RepID=A0AAV3NUR7_LITER
MGIALSSPIVFNNDSKQSFESVVVKSIDFGDSELKTPVRAIRFKSEDPEPQILQSLGSGRTLVERSVSFRADEFETSVESRFKQMFCQPSPSNSIGDNVPGLPILDPSNPKHKAAIKLQKVYKSFRTRRKLADCAVLIEQSWWKLLDFAELKHSSISFYDLEKNESPISRWSRARTRAAKVGKGLSKNGKAQKLAIQHWLEAIDPRHRYGHNLHFYYVKWLNSQSNQPFFYWLDIGEGKEINLEDKCPRSRLQQQCIKYLGPMERKAYEVAVEDGKLFYRDSGELLDTTECPVSSKWIFVLSSSKVLYVGMKRKGTFQHSSFLAGGATLAAGRLVVEEGNLKAVWPHSGHYRPTPENFQDFISFLRENNVDLTDVKLDSTEEVEESNVKKDFVHSRSNSSEDGLVEKDGLVEEENENESLATIKDTSPQEKTAPDLLSLKLKPSYYFSSKLTNLRIPNKDDLLGSLKREYNRAGTFLPESPSDGDEPPEELFSFDEHDNHHMHKSPSEEPGFPKEEFVSEECILQRIKLHSFMRSFQLGQQLACRWSTGAGPRIGCVRDYPSRLQSHALEQVSLSPRTAHRFILDRASTPSTLSAEFQVNFSMSPGNLSHSASCHFRPQSSLCKGILTASAPDLPQ